jgi:lysylphosphatidylglycerol synthetase-like protein (DUF2156 family)
MRTVRDRTVARKSPPEGNNMTKLDYSTSDDPQRRHRMLRFRNILILFYVGLIAASIAVVRHEMNTQAAAGNGFGVIFGFIAIVVLVVMLVLFYFASLFLAGILYRAGQKMWVVYVVSLTGGPVMVIAASWLWRLLH